MLREKPTALSAHADSQLLSSQPGYTLHDIMVTVTGLPSAGVVLKADHFTPVVLGDKLTAADLATLNLAPQLRRLEAAPPWSGRVIYIPQNCGRLPIPLFTDLPFGSVADNTVIITELPTNGSVFLVDGMTAVVCGQAVTVSQLCGLTFRPAANAVGQISLLRYRGSDQELVGEVLLVVGPDLPSFDSGETEANGDNSSLSPIAVALLLGAGLSSLNTTQASATVGPNDLLPPDPSTPSDVKAGMARQISGQAPGFGSDLVPDHIIVPASAIVAQTGTDTTGIDRNGHFAAATPSFGSSSPPDFGSLKLVPLSQSTTLTSTSVPSFDIANNAVFEIKGPSGTAVTFDTPNGELILDRSAQFHGLIGSSSPSTPTPLSPNDLIDLKDLPFTSGMTASVHYDSAANISTVDFSNGSKTVTLQFSGQDLNWIFKSDGQGGTIVADPPTTNPIVLENQKQGTPAERMADQPRSGFDQA